MSTTTRERPRGTDRVTVWCQTRRPRRRLPAKHERGTTNVPSPTICWRSSNKVLDQLPRQLEHPVSFPVPPTDPLPLVPDPCLLDGNNDLPPKVDLISSTTTHEQQPGSTPVANSSSVLLPRAKATCRSNLNPLASLVLCHLDGKCDSHPRPESTLSTTTPRRRPGTIPDCPRHWTKTSRSTSATLGESSSTSDLNRHCAPTRDNVTSRCLEIRFSRVLIPKL